ncbi:MAG: TRAP transporter small permease [Treponema sp.]|nr:TRAP transporter small permease [Treponema sp.]
MNVIAKVEEFFVCVCLALLILLVFFAAIFRFVGMQVAWSIDVAQMMFAWSVFIGADLALHRHKHLGVDILTKRLPRIARRVIIFMCYLLMLGFLSVIIFYGTKLCIVNYKRFFYTLPISYSAVTAAGPVGCALMFVTVVSHIVDFFREGAFQGPEISAAQNSVN